MWSGLLGGGGKRWKQNDGFPYIPVGGVFAWQIVPLLVVTTSLRVSCSTTRQQGFDSLCVVCKESWRKLYFVTLASSAWDWNIERKAQLCSYQQRKGGHCFGRLGGEVWWSNGPTGGTHHPPNAGTSLSPRAGGRSETSCECLWLPRVHSLSRGPHTSVCGCCVRARGLR